MPAEQEQPDLVSGLLCERPPSGTVSDTIGPPGQWPCVVQVWRRPVLTDQINLSCCDVTWQLVEYRWRFDRARGTRLSGRPRRRPSYAGIALLLETPTCLSFCCSDGLPCLLGYAGQWSGGWDLSLCQAQGPAGTCSSDIGSSSQDHGVGTPWPNFKLSTYRC
jgi:hypothetical protein